MARTPTIYDIKRRLKNCPLFFSRQNMKFAGQTMRDYKVRKLGRLCVLTAPLKDSGGTRVVGESLRYFDTVTDMMVLSGHYQFNEQWTGHPVRHTVVTYCGERIGSSSDINKAIEIALEHHKQFEHEA